MKSTIYPNPYRGVIFAVGLCSSAAMLTSNAVYAEPVERTYPPTACTPASITQANSRNWFKDIRGFRNDGNSNLTIQCPVVKQNIGAPLTRAFVWVRNQTEASSLRCTMSSTHLDGNRLRSFFTGVSASTSDEPEKLEFRADRLPDRSFPDNAEVERPSTYSIKCVLPRARSGSAQVLGYHVEEDA